MSEKAMKAIVLAAGKGTRLQSEGSTLPKVMRLAASRPLLAHVLSALDFIPARDTVLVVGYGKELVTEAFPGYAFALQDRQLGTGHAAACAMESLEGFRGDLLICCGDMPLLRRETYRALAEAHRAQGNDCTILSGFSDIPLPYGRIVRDDEGRFTGLVEDKDCTPEQKQIGELNSGVYIFDADGLRTVLGSLKNDNAQGEYYLTDAPALMLEKGMKTGVVCRNLGMEIIGVNTAEQLAQVERILLAEMRTQ